MAESHIDRQLAAARARYTRLEPAEAWTAQQAGALVVDIRCAADRDRYGRLPGALTVERTVLEWRLDPTSEAALPDAGYDRTVIVVCSEGYSSSLAAASLLDLGVPATDLVGGFHAWAAAGLPVLP